MSIDAGRYVELHTLKSSVEVGTHLVWHLITRLRVGNAMIVCERPEDMLASFAKRWKKIVRVVERERASTFKPEMREYTARLLKLLKNAHFIAKAPHASIGPMIWLVSPDYQGRIPKNCATLYLTAALDDTTRATLQARLPDNTAFIIYKTNDQVLPVKPPQN